MNKKILVEQIILEILNQEDEEPNYMVGAVDGVELGAKVGAGLGAGLGGLRGLIAANKRNNSSEMRKLLSALISNRASVYGQDSFNNEKYIKNYLNKKAGEPDLKFFKPLKFTDRDQETLDHLIKQRDTLKDGYLKDERKIKLNHNLKKFGNSATLGAVGGISGAFGGALSGLLPGVLYGLYREAKKEQKLKENQ